MDQSYWNIDSILADAAKLPCTFNIHAHNLGHLQSQDQLHLPQHTRIQLPYWLAELLALNDVVSISIPKAYGNRVKAALDANPASVQLRSQDTHWYALGMRLANLIDSEDLSNVLSKTYTGRLAQIYEQTQHLSSGSSSLGGSGSGGASGSRLGPHKNANARSLAASRADGQDPNTTNNNNDNDDDHGNDDNDDGQDPSTASASAIAAMVHDGPALGSAAGTGMSTEMAQFLGGLDESERILLAKGHQAARMMKEYLAAAAPR